jgi:hypothetical protein
VLVIDIEAFLLGVGNEPVDETVELRGVLELCPVAAPVEKHHA